MRSQISIYDVLFYFLVTIFVGSGTFFAPIIIEHYTDSRQTFTEKQDHKEYGGGRGTIITTPPPK